MDSLVSVMSAPTRTSVVSVVLETNKTLEVSTDNSTSVAALLEAVSVPTPSRDVSDPSAAPVVSKESTRTLAQEVPDLTPSVDNSSMLDFKPLADLTEESEASAVDKPSQVVPPRLPSLVLIRDNSSVEEAV